MLGKIASLFAAGWIAFVCLGAATPASEPAVGRPDLTKGWASFKEGSYADSMAAALVAARSTPGDPEALELWARSAMAAGEPGKAIPALNQLVARRGTARDLRLLALAQAMTGDAAASRATLLKAEEGKDPTPTDLYDLSWERDDTIGRLALLKRSAAAFPTEAPLLASEIAYWEARSPGALRALAAPLPAEGASVKLKTLYDGEWAVASLGGEEIWLLVDTAARQTVLSREVAERLKLSVVQAAHPLPGAFPQEPAPAYTCLDSLDLGPVKFLRVPALVVDDSARILRYREGRNVLKGILGMDLLRGMKVRFDRQKNVLRLLPAGASLAALLDGDRTGWGEYRAFPVHDQVFVDSLLGQKNGLLGLLATGCTYVLARETALPGTGLRADSKLLVNLSFTNFVTPASPVGEAAAGNSIARPILLGWLEECLPPVGTVRTVPKEGIVGFGPAKGVISDLPLFPASLGAEVPAQVVIGKKLTDFYAIALDLPAGKMYLKQVLFAR